MKSSNLLPIFTLCILLSFQSFQSEMRNLSVMPMFAEIPRSKSF